MKIKQHLSNFLRKSIQIMAVFFLSLFTFFKYLFSKFFQIISLLLTRLYQLTPLSFRHFIKKILRKIRVKTSNKYFSQIILVVILLGLFLGFMALRQPSSLKAPRLVPSSAISNSLYYASNNEFSVSIGERNTNKPIIEYSLPGGNKISFAYKNTQGKLTAPEEKNNSITFKDVSPNIDLKYTTLPKGLKEELIIKKQITTHSFDFNLNTTNAYPKTQTDSFFSSTFFDQKGNYLFHFEKPFAIDAHGARTDNVSVQIKKDTKTNVYSLTLNVDRNWLQSADRAYPIVIDPTIIHDTTAEFATGQFNRVFDTGSKVPNIKATGGDISIKNGNIIHTFNSSGTFTPLVSMNVEVLVVGGGGGGNSGTAGVFGGDGGGGGKIVYRSSYSVTTGNKTVTVGNGGTGTQHTNSGNGGDSVFDTLTATGGTGAVYTTAVGGSSGRDINGTVNSYTGGTGSGGDYQGGGGAGAGANGSGNNGGAGYTSSISGTSTGYGGGGSAATYTAVSTETDGGGHGYPGNATSGTAGATNRGGGGGGGGSNTGTGGNGGSGVVIISYPVTYSDNVPSLESYFQELPADQYTVGLWHFNETSGNALDSSGITNTLTPTGTTIVDGLLNKARSFTGTDNLTCSDANCGGTGKLDVTGGNAWTVEAWVNTSSGATTQSIVSKATTSQLAYQLVIVNGIVYANATNTAASWDAQRVGTRNIADGKWHHVAMVFKGSSFLDVYVDGTNDNSTLTGTVPAAIRDTTQAFYISTYDGTTQPFTGHIDEVRISNIARSAEEINLAAARRPYSILTSDILDLSNVNAWNSLKWNAFGLATGDGETATPSAASNLVAQWNFNSTSGTTATNDAGASSCGGTPTTCNGTLTNFASTGSQDAATNTGWTANNRRWGAGALTFDGTDDYVNVSDNNALDITSNLTISAWIYPKVSGNSAYRTIMAKRDSGGATNYQIYLNNDAGANAGKLAFYKGTWYISTYAPPVNQWTYVAAVISGSNNLTIYANGKPVHTATISSLSANAGSLAIGRNGDSAGEYFNGLIDVPSVYNRALTASEIASNYNAGRLEFQTRVGDTATPNDGTWEAWKPTAGETAIASMDSDSTNWNWDNSATYMPQAKSNESNIKVEGTGSLKQIIGQPQVDANTVGLWHFDETGGAGAYLKDSSGNNYNITPTLSSLTDGMSSKARSFNGTSDYLSRATVTSYNTARTVEFWFKPTALGTQRGIISSGNSVADTGPIWLIVQTSGNLLSVYHGSGYRNGTTVLQAGKWYHAAYTFNPTGNAVVLYLNGAVEYSGSVADANVNNTNLYIGTGYSGYFSGSIDEVRISNIARSAEQISEAYRMGRDHRISKTISSTDLSSANKIPFYIASDRLGTFAQLTIGESAFVNYEPDANNVGLWHLDEQSGSGAYIKDSANSNHGTPTTATYAQGKQGGGRSFNGTSGNINLGSGSTIDNIYATGGTVTAWIYAASFGESSYGRIVDKGSALTNGWGIFTCNSTNCNANSLAFFHNWGAGTDGWWSSPASSITTNKWTHVAIVYTQGSAANDPLFYINGQKVTTTRNVAPSAGTTDDSANDLYIGNRSGDDRTFSGTIDEITLSNTARTADDIRQMYEIGARTHNITIDFKAKLNSGNLITNSSDLGFTVDETPFGSYLSASHLFLGDKIIVKENYDGTEYIAQGTVNAVNSGTGAITVSSWDSGSTFPSGGFTINATVFKWQREYFDITNSLTSHRNTITRLTYRIFDGSQASNIWIDDLRSTSGYLNNPVGSTIDSSTGSRYFQYRAILSQNELSATSSALTSLTLDYDDNQPPNIPTLDFPSDTATNISVLPTLKTTASDPQPLEYLKYKINLCTDIAMTIGCKIFDQTATTSGWTASSYLSGNQATYTVQAADILSPGTLYYWKSLAIDQSGSNLWGNTQAAPFSFTTNFSPTAPTISANYLHDKIKIFDTTPEIRFSGTDPENESLVYQISWDTDADFATAITKTSDTDAGFSNITNPGDTSPFNVSDTISYIFQTPLTNNTTYFYRVRAKDPSGANTYSSWSTIRSLTIDTSIVKNQWFETHSDQFATDTLSTTYVDTINHTIRLTPKQINSADDVNDWVSSNDVSTPIFQESVIQQEGTGAVRAQKGTLYTTYPVDLMEYNSDVNAQAAYVTDNFFASGGTETNSGTYPAPMYHIHTFTSNGTFTVTNPRTMDYVMAAGGGGGELYRTDYGSTPGGGGGAGGVIASNSASFSAGSYPITIGNGGAAAVWSPRTFATQGQNTTFNSLTAIGGGRGGYNNVPGGSGGSGGGAAWPSSPGAGTPGQGYSGGTNQGGGGSGYPSGGGGGGGEPGHDAQGINSGEYINGHGGDGGNGLATSITGTASYIGGGGGGAVCANAASNYSGGTGGLGGGGNGAAANQNATSGSVNTGGGGGGACQTVAGAGGSGVVIIRYTFPTLQSYSESTFTTEGDYSLKGVAEATYSLNQTLTKTFSSPVDLTDQNSASLDIRSNRTGSNIKIGIHDTGGTTTEVTPNITAADTFQVASFDLSGVSNANKDAIDKIIITIVNAAAENTFYIDNFTSVLSPDNVTITNTRTAIDLSTNNALTFWVRSTVAGATTRFQFGETTSDEQIFNYTIDNPDTWEKKTWDISGISGSARDAVTKFAFKFTDAATGIQTFYFDDVRAINLGSVMSTPITAANIYTAETWNSLQFTDDVGANITYQVYYDVSGTPTIVPDIDLPGNSTGFATSAARITSLTTAAYPILYVKANFSDSNDTPILYDWGVTLNTVPEIPSLDSPLASASGIPRLTVFKTTSTDVDGDALRYKIHLCLDSAMTIGCKTFDQTVSTTGWDSAVPYASGAQATYTVQPADILNPNTTYYWKTYAIDDGSYWSATQTTPYSFTTNKPPNIPTLDLPIDTAISVIPLPTLKTTATDDDPAEILQYKINLCLDSAMTIGCKTFDQTATSSGWTAANYASGVQAVYTVQAANLLTPNTLYYWKSQAIDPAGSNTWSATQTTPFSFTTNRVPTTPTLDSPADGATDISSTTDLKTTTTDPDGNVLSYKINICKNPVMTDACQIYDQSADPTGWSATNYASGVQGIYTIQTTLEQGTLYYWKSLAIDLTGSNVWGQTQATPSSFTTKGNSIMPAPCTLTKAFDGSNITVHWTDTANEEEYQVWRVADGGIASLLMGGLAADTIQLVDSSVLKNHSYSYLVRGIRYDVLIPLYSAFCSTSTLHIPATGNSLLVN